MAIIDTERDVIVVRIVYDGPPLSGKSASVCALGNLLGRTPKVFSLEEESAGNRTLYFDWLEYTGGFFKGYSISCQIVSVPGQLSLAARHHLWQTADVVVFVLDASSDNLEIPLNYFKNVQQLVAGTGENTVQAIIQANQQDKPHAAATAQLKEIFQEYSQIKIVESVALSGKGIRETFVLAVRLAVERAATLMAKGQMRYGKPEISSGEEFVSVLRSVNFSLREETETLTELPEIFEGLKATDAVGGEESEIAVPEATEAVEGEESQVAVLATAAGLSENQEEIDFPSTTITVFDKELQPSGEVSVSSEVIPAMADIGVTEEEIGIDTGAIPAITDIGVTAEEIAIDTDTILAMDSLQGTEEMVAIDMDAIPTIDDFCVTQKETDIDTGAIPAKDNLRVIEEMVPPETDAVPLKENLRVFEETDNKPTVTKRSLAKSALTKHLPQFPDESTPTQWIWPPIHGRSILNRLLERALKPHLKYDKWWIIQALNEWHCFSKVEWQYPEALQARQALRTHIRLHLECSPILSEHRCVVVAINATKKAWRLWQIVPHELTLAEHLANSLRQESPAQVALEIFRCASRYVDALQQCLQYPLVLNLDLENLGVNAQSQLVYLGTIEETPAVERRAWNEVTLITAIKQEFAARIAKLLPQTEGEVAEILRELHKIDGFEHQYIVDALMQIFSEST
jgi:DNA-directed RNA polymerase subunit F